MLITYVRSDSLSGAVVKTFDGKHPCAMCLKIRDGRQQERHQQPPLATITSTTELGLAMIGAHPVAPPTRPTPLRRYAATCPDDIAHPPPKPPPRSA